MDPLKVESLESPAPQAGQLPPATRPLGVDAISIPGRPAPTPPQELPMGTVVIQAIDSVTSASFTASGLVAIQLIAIQTPTGI